MRTIRSIYLTMSILGLILILVGLAPQPVAASTLTGFTATPTSTTVPPTATATPVPTSPPPQSTPPPPTPQPEPPPLLPEAGGDDISGANAIRMELVIVGLVLLTGGFIMRVKFQSRKTS